VDKQTLMRRRAVLMTEDVELAPDVVVTVRALTNGQVRQCREAAGNNRLNYEHRLIAMALMDPEMTVAEVAQWAEGDPNDPEDVGAPAGDVVAIMGAIQRLSGLAEGDATKSVPPVRRKTRR
jgi:hypothetical protein